MSRLLIGQPRLLTWAAVSGLAIVIFGAAMDGDPAGGPQASYIASQSNGEVRLTGMVIPGTVQANGLGTSFTLETRGRQIPVVSDAALPGIVGEAQHVVVEGQMRSDGVWVADQVIDQVGSISRFPHG
jgi:cytochrome c-type biogenesis protein CcmE